MTDENIYNTWSRMNWCTMVELGDKLNLSNTVVSQAVSRQMLKIKQTQQKPEVAKIKKSIEAIEFQLVQAVIGDATESEIEQLKNLHKQKKNELLQYN